MSYRARRNSNRSTDTTWAHRRDQPRRPYAQACPASTEFPFIMASGEPVVVCADPQLESTMEGRERLVPMIERRVRRWTMLKIGAGSPYSGPVFSCCWPFRKHAPDFRTTTPNGLFVQFAARLSPSGVEGRVSGLPAGGTPERCTRFRALRRIFSRVGRDAVFLSRRRGQVITHPDTFIWLGRRSPFCPAGRFAAVSFRVKARAVFALAPVVDCNAPSTFTPLAAVVRRLGLGQESLLRDSETGLVWCGNDASRAARRRRVCNSPDEAVDHAVFGHQRRTLPQRGVGLRRDAYAKVWKSPGYEAPGDCWGDVGAAFGTLGGVSGGRNPSSRGHARGPRSLGDGRLGLRLAGRHALAGSTNACDRLEGDAPMANVSVNAPKTPVTEGSNGVATATLPNVCKMPGPPAPFVPAPMATSARAGVARRTTRRMSRSTGRPSPSGAPPSARWATWRVRGPAAG